MKINKSLVLSQCTLIVLNRLKDIQEAIDSSNQSITEDTKSSAGDKYETSREMIQQDLNRYQQQLKIAQLDISILKRIEESENSKALIGLGSLVETDDGYYFISISIGDLKIKENRVFAISPQSPIGKELIGKTIGESFMFLGKDHVIKSIE